MIVEVDIKRTDLLGMNLFVMPRLKYNWIFLGLLMLLYITIFILNIERPDLFALILSVSVGVVLAVIAFLFISAVLLVMGLLFASESTGLGWHRYEIKDDGLVETTNINEDYSKWVAFGSVWKGNRYIFLQKNWMLYHVFPKRCFDSSDAFNEFHLKLKEKLTK